LAPIDWKKLTNQSLSRCSKQMGPLSSRPMGLTLGIAISSHRISVGDIDKTAPLQYLAMTTSLTLAAHATAEKPSGSASNW
jgi:hypothetical protein